MLIENEGMIFSGPWSRESQLTLSVQNFELAFLRGSFHFHHLSCFRTCLTENFFERASLKPISHFYCECSNQTSSVQISELAFLKESCHFPHLSCLRTLFIGYFLSKLPWNQPVISIVNVLSRPHPYETMSWHSWTDHVIFNIKHAYRTFSYKIILPGFLDTPSVDELCSW